MTLDIGEQVGKAGEVRPGVGAETASRVPDRSARIWTDSPALWLLSSTLPMVTPTSPGSRWLTYTRSAPQTSTTSLH